MANIEVHDAGDDGIATLAIARPEVRNALDGATVEQLHRALEKLALAPPKCLIIRGSGDKAFVGGADIGELKERDHSAALRKINAALFRAVEEFPSPTIAAIQGFALGGGCELALACDMRICGRSSELGQPEVGLGIIPGAGATYRLPRLVGQGMARELIFTGRLVDAEEALRIGLVNRVVDDSAVIDEAHALALAIGKNGTFAVQLAKRALNVGATASIDVAMAHEAALQAMLFDHSEKHERMGAFLARKKEKKS